MKAAFDIFKDAVDKMVDKSCDSETEEKIRSRVSSQDDVIGIDMLKTRVFGNRIYVDIEICADGSKTICEGHDIPENKAFWQSLCPKLKIYDLPGTHDDIVCGDIHSDFVVRKVNKDYNKKNK